MDERTWSVWRIYTQRDGSAIVDYETNDDNDDGYPDREAVTAQYHPRTVKTALEMAGGKSHIGLYGNSVTVYLDGEEVKP